MRLKNHKESIFKEINGKLKFIGDFESLYKNQNDPWQQSGKEGEISLYYSHSRKRLVNQLKKLNSNSLLEVGCGLGYTTQIIQESIPECYVVGMDISKTAIVKANNLFPNLNFIEGDISSFNLLLEKKYDIIILNQLLWYILESLSNTFENCFKLLNPKGKLIISQAFLQTPQKYGKEICDGFDGLVKYLNKNNIFNIEYSSYDNFSSFIHNDGLIILNKN